MGGKRVSWNPMTDHYEYLYVQRCYDTIFKRAWSMFQEAHSGESSSPPTSSAPCSAASTPSPAPPQTPTPNTATAPTTTPPP
eukprot:411342-Alexandrium_andersonii.AAC.1